MMMMMMMIQNLLRDSLFVHSCNMFTLSYCFCQFAFQGAYLNTQISLTDFAVSALLKSGQLVHTGIHNLIGCDLCLT
jgi:hypothetical protein